MSTYKEQLDSHNERILAVTEALMDKFSDTIKIDGNPVDGGYLRYVSETGNAETVLPDTAINSESNNVPTSKAVAQFVSAIVSTINGFKKEIVDALPTENIDENTIYLVPKTSGSGNDYYDEYLYINGNFEFIGSTQVDLTNYVKNTDYATRDIAGVVKLGNYGIVQFHNGIIGVEEPTDEQLKTKTGYRAVTVRTLDKAMKVGLTTNAETLTDEEKASAQSWLGTPQFTATQLEDGSYSLSITTPTTEV